MVGASCPTNGDLPPHLDFVTARTEFYTEPTALPTVERSSIKLDLHRRDFTINTLALCLNPDRWAELLDSYGGINDLRLELVRVLHSLSFVDDPTRILRAVRYEQRFRFSIEARTLELLEDAADLIDRVSPARVRHELERILLEEMPEYAMRRLDELGVLARLHPQLVVDDWVVRKFGELRRARAMTGVDPRLHDEPLARQYWGALTYRLSPEVDAQLVDRLALRGETQRLVEALDRLRRVEPDLSRPGLRPSEIARLLDPVSVAALVLGEAVLLDDPLAIERVGMYLAAWRAVKPELDGNDLRAMGIARGPIYGEIMRVLRAARLDGEIRTREDEQALVATLLHASEGTEYTEDERPSEGSPDDVG
jgi:tRNA nucleotidyltransferase (CCA-adding enzyme)